MDNDGQWLNNLEISRMQTSIITITLLKFSKDFDSCMLQAFAGYEIGVRLEMACVTGCIELHFRRSCMHRVAFQRLCFTPSRRCNTFCARPCTHTRCGRNSPRYCLTRVEHQRDNPKVLRISHTMQAFLLTRRSIVRQICLHMVMQSCPCLKISSS